jgi:hypothetical protein
MHAVAQGLPLALPEPGGWISHKIGGTLVVEDLDSTSEADEAPRRVSKTAKLKTFAERVERSSRSHCKFAWR